MKSEAPSGKKVLIVDDDPFIVGMYSIKLKEAGFFVESVPDGAKALEKIEGGGYDVVLLDVVLPLLDGFEIMTKLQASKKPRPPIILLTNLGQKEDVERGLALGAVDYVIKAHFTPSEVLARVEKALRHA